MHFTHCGRIFLTIHFSFGVGICQWAIRCIRINKLEQTIWSHHRQVLNRCNCFHVPFPSDFFFCVNMTRTHALHMPNERYIIYRSFDVETTCWNVQWKWGVRRRSLDVRIRVKNVNWNIRNYVNHAMRWCCCCWNQFTRNYFEIKRIQIMNLWWWWWWRCPRVHLKRWLVEASSSLHFALNDTDVINFNWNHIKIKLSSTWVWVTSVAIFQNQKWSNHESNATFQMNTCIHLVHSPYDSYHNHVSKWSKKSANMWMILLNKCNA